MRLAIDGQELAFSFGSRVRFRTAHEIVGIITATCVGAGGTVTYEIRWLHEGDVKTAWVYGEQIEHAPEEEDSLGFKKGQRDE